MRIAIAILTCSAAFAQEFEVASIKVAAPPDASGGVFVGAPRGGPDSDDPAHINWAGATLLHILQTAYGVKNYQIEGPDWLSDERYDIAVAVPESVTKEQVAIMWQNLLASRFGMKVHKTQKEVPVDELVIGPRGHKLKENNETPPPPGADGKNNPTRPSMTMTARRGPNGTVAQTIAKAQPISALVIMLSNQVGHPVVDKTGLAGRYDFTIEYAPSELPAQPNAGARDPAPPPADLGLDLPGALQQQLGLRLVKGKGMLDVIVVDKAEKVPTEN